MDLFESRIGQNGANKSNIGGRAAIVVRSNVMISGSVKGCHLTCRWHLIKGTVSCNDIF